MYVTIDLAAYFADFNVFITWPIEALPLLGLVFIAVNFYNNYKKYHYIQPVSQ